MRAALALALAAAAVAVSPVTARAANECRGLPVCIPVAGPWVAVPATRDGVPHPVVLYELRCPARGQVVAGTDARLSTREIAVGFAGTLGSPVSPGVTTSSSALFSARYVGAGSAPVSFRPFLGCVPTSGGGRSTTSATAPAAVAPGKPVVRRVRTVRVGVGRATHASAGCRPDERLVESSYALAFRTKTEPPASVLGGVRATRREQGDRVLVTARRSRAVPAGMRVEVQVHAVCAGGSP